jgi:hypothetical protein
MDIDTLYLYQRIEALEYHMNTLLHGVTCLAVDDPFVQAKTDLTEWRVGVMTGRSTYLQGWLLYQHALWELETERLIYPADASGREAA